MGFHVHWQENQISILSTFRLIYKGEVYFHLWFIYALAGVYLAFPFAGATTNPDNPRLLYWFVGCCILFGSILPTFDRIGSASSGFPVQFGIRPTMFWMHFGYAALGVLIARIPLNRRNQLLAFSILLVSSVFASAVTAIGWLRYESEPGLWLRYVSPLVILSSASVFYLLRRVNPGLRTSRLLKGFGGLSFCLYLCHPLFQEGLLRSGYQTSNSSIIGIPIYLFLTLALSTAASFLLLRIPRVGKLFG